MSYKKGVIGGKTFDGEECVFFQVGRVSKKPGTPKNNGIVVNINRKIHLPMSFSIVIVLSVSFRCGCV